MVVCDDLDLDEVVSWSYLRKEHHRIVGPLVNIVLYQGALALMHLMLGGGRVLSILQTNPHW